MNKRLLTFPYLLWIIIFTVIPIGILLYYGLTIETDGIIKFSMNNLLKIASRENSKALGLACLLAFFSTLICLFLAYPLAIILAIKNVSKNSFILFILILPMWMNFLLRTYAWLTLIEKNGVINALLTWLRLPNVKIINTNGAIILGMVYNFLPFMILPIYNVLIKLDHSLIEASKDLGANKIQTFIKVILPLSLPGIISGITMVFVPAITTFVIPNLLGGAKIQLIGNIIEQEFTFSNNWHVGSSLSLILMILVIISMAIVSKYDKDGGTNIC